TCAGTPCLCGREPGLCLALAGAAGSGGGALINEAEEATADGVEAVTACVEGAPNTIEMAIPEFAESGSLIAEGDIPEESVDLGGQMMDLEADFKANLSGIQDEL